MTPGRMVWSLQQQQAMNIAEATDALRPGEKYIYLTLKSIREKLSPEQLGRPITDGIVVQFSGIDIISIDIGGGVYEWQAGGYMPQPTLKEAVNQIQRRLTSLRADQVEENEARRSMGEKELGIELL
jgi:hypothetical protein